jgi:hypothetical protein
MHPEPVDAGTTEKGCEAMTIAKGEAIKVETIDPRAGGEMG